jgi:hypothetical protein
MEKRVLKIDGENIEIIIDKNNDAIEKESDKTLDLTEVVEEVNGKKED